ncbi:adenylate/guanylate cyclase [marine gamma proteobacterium HTCC2143]|jgi:adenylate cyclase|uniref:Adenylate/guanylate cyclase n=1 Tax=marine gamma proteobacterium HTCC2143 TaxID=247633 RepID=A0Y7P2_9GAMM|nr:adenylate/guanylate cyclase [marine gamma proteobacterium HTCC2143]
MDENTVRGTGSIPMAIKLSLLIVSIMVIATAIQGLIIASQQGELLEHEIEKFGFATSRLLVRQIKEPLLAKDDLALEQIVQSSVRDNGVAGITITSIEGEKIARSGFNPTFDVSAIETPVAWADLQQQQYISFFEIAYSNDLKIGEVLVTIHADSLDKVRSDATRSIIYSTLIMIVIGVIITAWISRRVTGPIVRIINISRKIASGDYQARFNEKSSGELAVLVQSLNAMTTQLLHKIHLEQTFSRYISPKVAKAVLAGMAPQELGGKEVNGSVLFADIVGFTSISETMKAEKVSQLLNDYFTYIDQTAHHCDGHVDKYMGDCAMILFGVPDPDSNHLSNAVYCALLIHRVIERVNRDRLEHGDVAVSFSAGVNAGPMLAGNMGSRSRMEYTVVGDTVNTASRLAAISGPGEIIVTEAVAKNINIARQFETTEVNAVKLKGKKNPITVYRIDRGNEETEHKLDRDLGIILSAVESGE